MSNGTAGAITDGSRFNLETETIFENGNRSWHEECKSTSEETVIEESESSSESAVIQEPEFFEDDTKLLPATVRASETDKYTAALERLTAWASESDLPSPPDSDENSGVDAKLWEKNGVRASQNGSTNGYGNGHSGRHANSRMTEIDDVSLELEELAGPSDHFDQ